MTLILNVSQIIVSLLIIGLVLIQDRSSDAGGIFGGGDTGGFYQARRGLEKIIFALTIIAIIIFTGLAIAHFLI